MKNPYKVLKDYSGFKKGDTRMCHPSVGDKLVKEGLLEAMDVKDEAVKEEVKKATKDKKPEPQKKPYLVKKDHGTFKKGDERLLHKSLASKLAAAGLIELKEVKPTADDPKKIAELLGIEFAKNISAKKLQDKIDEVILDLELRAEGLGLEVTEDLTPATLKQLVEDAEKAITE